MKLFCTLFAIRSGENIFIKDCHPCFHGDFVLRVPSNLQASLSKIAFNLAHHRRLLPWNAPKIEVGCSNKAEKYRTAMILLCLLSDAAPRTWLLKQRWLLPVSRNISYVPMIANCFINIAKWSAMYFKWRQGRFFVQGLAIVSFHWHCGIPSSRPLPLNFQCCPPREPSEFFKPGRNIASWFAEVLFHGTWWKFAKRICFLGASFRCWVDHPERARSWFFTCRFADLLDCVVVSAIYGTRRSDLTSCVHFTLQVLTFCQWKWPIESLMQCTCNSLLFCLRRNLCSCIFSGTRDDDSDHSMSWQMILSHCQWSQNTSACWCSFSSRNCELTSVHV